MIAKSWVCCAVHGHLCLTVYFGSSICIFICLLLNAVSTTSEDGKFLGIIWISYLFFYITSLLSLRLMLKNIRDTLLQFGSFSFKAVSLNFHITSVFTHSEVLGKRLRERLLIFPELFLIMQESRPQQKWEVPRTVRHSKIVVFFLVFH